ncbi:MAG: cupin domain-containing protein [Candidatus Omnitrophica bacterium]|nr:cupin domain-containing protein [Candidatus Omnitrophota bacterium]
MAKVKVETPTKEQLKSLGVDTWSKWECDVKKFDWEYDEKEMFYVLEGKVNVVTDEGEKVEFEKGNLVTFSKGVKCKWDVKEKISKVYKFG